MPLRYSCSKPVHGHDYHNCQRTPGDSSCGGCRVDGQDCLYETLSVCKVCGCLEGALLPYCPGRQLSFEESEAAYTHYCSGTGPWASARLDNVQEAVAFAVTYIREAGSEVTPGALRFASAITELLGFLLEETLVEWTTKQAAETRPA